jgi:hypothetical protein
MQFNANQKGRRRYLWETIPQCRSFDLRGNLEKNWCQGQALRDLLWTPGSTVDVSFKSERSTASPLVICYRLSFHAFPGYSQPHRRWESKSGGLVISAIMFTTREPHGRATCKLPT